MQGVRGRAAAGGRGRPGEAGSGRGAGRMQSRRGRAARHDSAAGRCPFRGRRGSAEPVGPCGAVSPAGRGGGGTGSGAKGARRGRGTRGERDGAPPFAAAAAAGEKRPGGEV